jgi:hypothetical protein
VAVDIASTITYLKDHAIEHGFHVHDERHFVETFTLRQAWEIDVHPAEACSGPLDLHISLDMDPRMLLRFEDLLADTPDVPEDPGNEYSVTFYFNWSLPPMQDAPDLIVLSAELAGMGGIDMPIEVRSVRSMSALGDTNEDRLSIVGAFEQSLVDVMFRQDALCDALDRVHDVSMYMLEHADDWTDDV